MIYKVYVQRKGHNHFNLVGHYKMQGNAKEVEEYYKNQSWVSDIKIEIIKVI